MKISDRTQDKSAGRLSARLADAAAAESPTAFAAEPATRSVSIMEDLRCAILAGEFPPGERLLEVALSERLGVSRTPIRAALQALAGEGLLVHTPNRGYYVRTFSIEEIIQAYEIRATLEGLAAKRAALLGLTAEQRIAMETALRDGDRLLARGAVSPNDHPCRGAVADAARHAAHPAADRAVLAPQRHRLRICRRPPPPRRPPPRLRGDPLPRRRPG
jgi:GntR family transcriptional regulator of vanillate catabolism